MSAPFSVRIASTDEEIDRCHPVMAELRPHVPREGFVERVRRQEKDHYRLAFLEDGGEVMAVAGFRASECLAWGRFIYVDDPVTSPRERSKGYGRAMLSWLLEYARSLGWTSRPTTSPSNSGKTGVDGDAMRKLGRFAIGAFVVALLVGAVVAEDDSPSLEALGWMAGHWSLEKGGLSMEEFWTPPKGGVMLGLHRDVREGGRAFFEYLRIEERPEGLVYLASPMGREATPFPLLTLEDGKVVFENPDHDYPQRIIYEIRDGGTLRARIEGLRDGKLAASEWTWRRSDP